MNLLQNVLNSTDNVHHPVVDEYIMAYPLYWCLSAINYLWHSASTSSPTSTSTSISTMSTLEAQLLQDIAVLVDRRIGDFLDPDLDITWFGWDDRIGNGWCFHKNNDTCTREAQLTFADLGKRTVCV